MCYLGPQEPRIRIKHVMQQIFSGKHFRWLNNMAIFDKEDSEFDPTWSLH